LALTKRKWTRWPWELSYRMDIGVDKKFIRKLVGARREIPDLSLSAQR
jgi:hypothetical protein